MKKIIVFIFVLLIICLLKVSFVSELKLTDIFSDVDVEAFITNDELPNFDYIKNGEGIVVFCKLGDLEYINNNYLLNGFTIKLKDNDKSIMEKLGAIIHVQNDFGFYGFSSVIARDYNFKYKNNNFQMVYSNGTTLIGCPLLLGGY